ncbi:MAG: SDR family NAD(P)-dependent oxidoreductase [Pseudomonadota bacterium]
MTAPDPAPEPFRGRIALVTGASRGIGRAVAEALGAAGAQVVAVARTVGGLEDLDDAIKAAGGPPATLVPLDLSDMDAIDRLGAAILGRWNKLDILIGNAAMLGALTPLTHMEPKDWQKLMDVNVTANYRLLRICEPLLQRSDAPRAVFVTSTVAQDYRAFWGPYATTKAALEAMVLCYAADMRKSSFKINLLNPGATATAMRAKAMPGEDASTLPAPKDLVPLFLELAGPGCARHGEVVTYREWRKG